MMSNECGSFDHCGCKDKVDKLKAELKDRSGLTRMQVNDILMEHEDLEAELERIRKGMKWALSYEECQRVMEGKSEE
jgi:hypothetical protein